MCRGGVMKESSPAGTTVPTRKSAEAIARIATISDNTRSYLTLLGKLHDCYGEFVELVERNYGSEQVDGFTKYFECHVLELFSIVEKFAISSISERLGCYDTEI